MNRCTADKCHQSVMRYPLDRELFSGYCYSPFEQPRLGAYMDNDNLLREFDAILVGGQPAVE